LEKVVRGFEQPNDILRRVLLKAPRAELPSVGRRMSTSIPGALVSLIAKGFLKPGDTLSHVQVRKGRSFVGVVEADGWVRTDIKRYKEPSPALGDLVGTSIDGWAYWTHDRSGKTLRQLRQDSGGKGRGEM
jgi:hypothetical protein